MIILGKTASGKDTIVNKLVKDYGYKKIITYTTRDMRQGEKQGITYHFVSEDEFRQKINKGFFAEYKTYNTEFGKWYYGSALEDLNNADDKTVIILTPQGYRDVKDKLSNKNITTIYINADNETLKKRLVRRGDDPKEAARRIKHDNVDFKHIEREVDSVIYNKEGTNINDVVSDIIFELNKEIA